MNHTFNNNQDNASSHEITVVSIEPVGIAISQDLQMSSVLASDAARIHTSLTSIPTIASNPLKVKRDILPAQSPSSKKPRLSIFSENVASPSLSAAFLSPGARFENVAQLVHCGNLLRKYFSPSSAATATVVEHLEPAQRALIELYTQNGDERNRIRSLIQMVVEELAADNPKTTAVFFEVLLLAPSLDLEHYRKLLNCVIAEFETARLLDIALLQGLVQLVESASPDYLEPDDLVRILVVLRTRLQDTHQQSAKHPYYLTWALSCLLDFMVEGKVKELRRVVDQEPLTALFNQLKESDDPYLRRQATYAFQGLLHVPNDEARRQCMLRNAGNITMGLLGVASVCKLDLGQLRDGSNHVYDATEEVHEFGSKIIDGSRSLFESGQRTLASMKGGIFSGGRQLWYTSLCEAKQYIRNGRLQDFNSLVFEAPCRDHIDFQWGICRLVGEIAFGALWETSIRRKAVDFLSALYTCDLSWTTSEDVYRWILDILRMIMALGDSTVSAHAQLILQGLEHTGNVAKQELYRNTMAGSLCSYPIQFRLSIPTSSTLLLQALAIPSVEDDLLRLKSLRLGEQENILYIHPQAKPSLQASDDTLFPLMEKVLEFLTSSAQVFLLLGDSGGGKSTFNLCLERTLWKSYKKGEPIPLHINLPSIDNPRQDMIAKQLRQLDFTATQIMELKQSRRFIVICDGYDESQLMSNIYTSNHFNQPGQWKVKMIVACRTQYLGSNYRNWFIPQGNSAYDHPTPDLFQEAVIAPFTKEQIERYIDIYVPLEPRTWDTKDYMDKLTTIQNLMDLVKNPFLLFLAMEALPGVTDGKQDMSKIEVTRVQLYDTFVQHWMEVNERRLQKNNNALSCEDQRIWVQLVDEGFVTRGIEFSTKLARMIFEEHEGNPVVQYVYSRDKNTWKAEFFGPQAEARILRELSPLTRAGNSFRFVHRSLQEYFFSRLIFNPTENEEDLQHGAVPTASQHLDADGPLFQRNLLQEPSVINFLCDRVKLNPDFKHQLRTVIELSKTDANAAVAATNAITILVRAGVSFNGEDLRGIRVPGADLSSGQFDSAQFQGADLMKVNFSKCWLRRADMSEAYMEGVRFGELPYLEMDEHVCSCAYSPDGKMLGVGLHNGIINIYDTSIWTRKYRLEGHSREAYSIVFSLDSRRLISGGDDKTVRLWDTTSGEQLLVMEGHTDAILSVAISPCGNQIASAGHDEKMRLWSMQTGETLFAWKGHYSRITSIEYSPDGRQLATGSMDRTIRFWNAETGKLRDVLSAPAEPGMLLKLPGYENSETGEPVLDLSPFSRNVLSLAYSPDGRWLAAGHIVGLMQLWDTASLEQGPILSGHANGVTGIAFSLDGQWIASSSQDQTVILWDASTNALVTTLTGHNASVNCVAFSPDGHQIASGGDDKKVRLWEVGCSWSSLDPRHGGHIASLAYSLDGRSLLSYDDHETFLKWNAVTGTSAPIHFAEIVPEEERGKFVSKACALDGSQLAFGYDDGSIRLWNCQTSTVGLVLKGHSGITGLEYSPCCRWIISAASNCTVQLWDLHDAEPQPLPVDISRDLGQHTGVMTFSSSGDRFAIVHGDLFPMGTISVFDTPSREHQGQIRLKDDILSLAYSPNGRQVAIGTYQGNIFLWDLQSNEPGAIHNADKGQGHMVGCIAYSPCGQWIASTCDRTVGIWHRQLSGEVESWSRVHSITGFLGQVYRVSWNPIIPMELATSVSDGSVQVWRMSIGEGGNVAFKMVWGTNMSILCTEGAVFAGAVGLNPMYRELLTQRGAIGLS